MDSITDTEQKNTQEPLLGTPTTNTKGGLRTLPFIIANEAFESLASNGLHINMIMYLTKEYGMGNAYAAKLLCLWSAACYITPVIGAVIADTFTGRFRMISFGCVISLLGTTLMWLTTFLPHSSTCDQFKTCVVPIASQILLFFAFALMSIGAGGIRSSSLPFGTDQLNMGGNLSNKRILESYFSWYYAAVSASVVIAASCIVYIQEKMGWKIGFGIPAMLMFLSALSFFLASPFYVKLKAKSSLLTGYAQVLLASYKNRNVEVSTQVGNVIYHRRKGSMLVVPSEKLKCLNKACIIRNPEQDLTPDGQALDPWSLCTIDDVEEVKAIIRVVPMWSTGIMMYVSISQGSLIVLMAVTMDRHITSSFEVPAATFSMFLIIAIAIWVILYDRVFIPLASKVIGKPAYLNPKQRMGIGILCGSVSVAALAVVESLRRGISIQGEPPMSAMWLLLHFIVAGVGEAFNAVGQNEFYYSELPKSISSIALSLQGVGISMGSLMSGLMLILVDSITKTGGHGSWISDNINEGHYDYYFWLLAGLCLLNFVYFMACSNAYGPCNRGGKNNVEDIE